MHATSSVGSTLRDGRARAAYALKVGRVFAEHPHEALDRARDVLADRKERRRRPFRYEATSDWHRPLHDLFSLPWPCDAVAEFDHIWSTLVRELSARSLSPGRATYGGWDDAGPALALAAYCLTRHLRPERAVETGVAHGVTTRFVLEALERNGGGALWSIDLPPLVASGLQHEFALAVPEALRDRWTLCLGSSRQQLPGLVEQLGSIDLFIHDSLHTERNLRCELDHAWDALRSSGAVIVDDVDYNLGLRAFVEQVPGTSHLVAEHDDRQRLFGVIRKEPG